MSENELVITRDELDRLRDDLYALACAVDDTERDLRAVGPSPTVADLRDMLDWLLTSAKPLRDREFSAAAQPG